MNGRQFNVLAALVLLAIAMILALSQAAAQTGHGYTRDAPTGPMVDRCRDVMAELKILGTEVLELDQRLATKAEPMNTMDTEERLDAMQGVIEELIVQRRVERRKIKITHQKVFSHLMQHMMIDDPVAHRASLHACPLLKRIDREPRVGDTTSVDLELKY